MSTVSVTFTYDTDDIDGTFTSTVTDPEMKTPEFVMIFDDADNLHTFNPGSWDEHTVGAHALSFLQLVAEVHNGDHPNEAGR